MDNIKDDNYYLQKIIEYIDFSINSLQDITLVEFENDEVLLNAIMFAFIQISEYSLKLSNEYKSSNADFPWNEIKSIRNRIVHNYDIVENEIIYNTVKVDLIIFKNKILKQR